ncbi:DNA-binding protein [Hymenobacter amundsenii]|uniref:DNA-binding protein n=1 Tax=Hymenobacter amundsenii TaxID=2006685 RepID=A0A246FQQ8_9BACT|nr:helix-turn-helix domain-containing protein [Hymenobacter amundsenii]OWP65075.1 DNA-binding protein [Hymenobacter amundsenii]
MQVALIIPEAEWRALVADVEQLKQEAERIKAATPAALPDDILTVPQAAAALGLTPEAVRRARREGRLKGIRRNEKEWGFYRSVIEQFPRRYHRQGR